MTHEPRAFRNVDDFLRLILRSGLLDRTQLQEAMRSMPAAERNSATAIAEHLVKLGKLSRFQANKLTQGSYRGLVLGSFQLLAPIGRGGMGGMVYLARDQRSSQLLALKVLPPDRARSEERILARFRREMEMSQRVSHPHVAWTFDVGVCQGIHYMAMEYIPGKSLQRLVAEEGPLPVSRTARLMAEVASALEHTHTQGLVHRDIKPANIMVTPHGHAKLLDLGLALVRGEKGGMREVIGGQGYVVGTMDYIAPEQTEDPTRVDGRSDIYSLGCTMYYALSGKLPFPGGDNKEKMQKQREEKPRPLEELNPGVPAGFIALVNRMMAKDPAQRFQTAGEAEQAFQQWETGERVLPMDRPDDTAFLEAVAQLEAAAASDDVEFLPGEPTPGSESQAALGGERGSKSTDAGVQTALLQSETSSPRLVPLSAALWLAGAGILLGMILMLILILILK
jgi:serine/threonine protein kinase